MKKSSTTSCGVMLLLVLLLATIIAFDRLDDSFPIQSGAGVCVWAWNPISYSRSSKLYSFPRAAITTVNSVDSSWGSIGGCTVRKTAFILCGTIRDDETNDDDIRNDIQQQQQHLPTSSNTASDAAASNHNDTDNNNNNNNNNNEYSSTSEDMDPIPRSLEKKIRVAKAQSEIDRILSGPDPLFDPETELKRVLSLHVPPGAQLPVPIQDNNNNNKKNQTRCSPTEEEEEIEMSEVRKTLLQQDMTMGSTIVDDEILQKEIQMQQDENVCQTLENELYQAVKQQDYETAAQKRKSLNELHMDDSWAVLQVNAAFYKAFSTKDYAQMEALWMHDDSVTCIHPTYSPIIGAAQLCSSWKQLFHTAQICNYQRIRIEPTNIHVVVRGSATAVLTCDEVISGRLFVRGQRRQTECIRSRMATNIFRKLNGQWYLAHHHASLYPELHSIRAKTQSMPQQQLQRPQPQQSSLSSLQQQQQRRRNGIPDRIMSQQQEDVDAKIWKVEDILGIPSAGPLIGDMAKPVSVRGNRKIVLGMGGLSDLLNGNLEDILGKSNQGNTNSDATTGKNDNNELNGASAIIRFERIENMEDDDDDDEEEDDEEDDDDDDDDDEEVELIVDDDEEDESDDDTTDTVTVIKDWVDANETKRKRSKYVAPPSSQSKSPTNQEPSVRQRCIASLRQLQSRGSISNRQKRVLLTDIISCSARGESSMVEVAYELLFTSQEDEDDIAEEEFADQCRILAESLPDSSVTNNAM